MRFLIFIATVLALVSAQEPPEGYVSKEVIERLFKATQGGDDIFIGELSPLFVEYGIPLPEGYQLLGSVERDYGMGMMGASEQLNANAYFDAANEVSLESFRDTLLSDGWTNLEAALSTVWGFTGAEQTVFSNTYGSYCKDNALFGYSIYEEFLNFNLDSYGKEVDTCAEQLAQSQTYLESQDAGINVPDLQLIPPATSVALVAEAIPYYPVASSTIEGVDLPGGWGSRTTLSTTLEPSRVLELYNAQMERAGWVMGRSNADELNDWSEWTFTDKAGQDWLATVTVTHHEAYPGVVMPILIVLEK
jgi:hypothetical protein